MKQHLNSVYALVLTGAYLYSPVTLADLERTYVEDGGVVAFELETADSLTEGWTLKTELDDYRGSGYLEWTGDNFFAGPGNSQDAMIYHFRVNTAGNYQMRWRSRISTGDSNTEHNDSWIRLATGTNITDEQALSGWTKVYMNQLGSWSWDAKTVDHVGKPIRQYFSAGDHTLEITGRSAGHAIDRVVIYKYDDVGFSTSKFNNYSVSATVTGDGSLQEGGGEPVGGGDTTVETPVPLSNAEWFDRTGNTQEPDVCEANTLVLSPLEDAELDTTGSSSAFSNDIEMTVAELQQSVLLKFDLTSVPTVTTAKLEYSTGDQDADTTLNFHLGSHSNWADSDSSTDSPPQATVLVASAAGGFVADSSYRTQLDESLLVSGLNTVLVSSQPGDDPMRLKAVENSTQAPRLVLSGDSSFCDTWQSNIDALNTTQPETNETVGEPNTDTSTDTESESESENQVQSGTTTQSTDAATGAGSMSKELLIAMLMLGILVVASKGNIRTVKIKR